ncbi:MAG: hypothetical protein HY697_03290 [Deltaproteobacteria bacterium]|nr:hypothetical protein [Deltaproteobacteria bacterium]
MGKCLKIVLTAGGMLLLLAAGALAQPIPAPPDREDAPWSAIIATHPLDPWGAIIDSKEDILTLSQGETVYLKLEPGKEVKAGDRFFLLQTGQVVTHPVTGRKLGRLVILAGECQALDGNREIVSAMIVKTRRSIYRGDQVVPRLPVVEAGFTQTRQKIEGLVILALEGERAISEREVIFIDRGIRDGVIVGDRLAIFKLGDFAPQVLERYKEELPMAQVGEAVIVAVQEETSSALVTLSSQAIYVGDRVVSAPK